MSGNVPASGPERATIRVVNPSTQHPRLRGARLKLRRAHEHLVRIAEEARRVTDPESFRLTYEVEGGGVHHVWRIHGLLTLDEMFSLWVGDCAHNLRSVLDHIAWELVSCSGQMPSTATHFPLKDVRPKQLSITPDPGTAAMNIVDQFQPYQSGGSHALLALLHLLDIIDKHRDDHGPIAITACYIGFMLPMMVEIQWWDKTWERTQDA